MRLGAVIEVLRGMPADAVIRPGFHNVCTVIPDGPFRLSVNFAEAKSQTVTEALAAIHTAVASSSLLDSQATMSVGGQGAEPITRLWLMSATVPIDVVFDAPPSPHLGGRFVETEDGRRYSVGCGEWVEREEGLTALRINVAMGDVRRSEIPRAES